MREYIYLWIDKYIQVDNDAEGKEHYLFENIGIPLSSKYTVDFDGKSSTIGITRNRYYDVGYFSERISDIVAIVGNNGVGKSCLLMLLNRVLTSGSGNIGTDDIKYKLICVDSEAKRDEIDVVLKDSDFAYEKCCRLLIEDDVQSEIRLDVDTGSSVDQEYKCDYVIFYSPFFSNESSKTSQFHIGADVLGSRDISTMASIDVYTNRLCNSDKYRHLFDRLDTYSFYEQQIELEFLADFLDNVDKLPMDLPKYTTIYGNDYPVGIVLTELREKHSGNETLLTFIEGWNNRNRKGGIDLKNRIYLSVFACLYKSKNIKHRHLFDKITETTTIDEMISKLDIVTDGRLKELTDLINKTTRYRGNRLRIKEQKKELKEIMDCHYCIRKDYHLLIPFLLFSRQRLSTGENNYIQLFARFYNIWKYSNEQVGSVFEAKEIVFLIDEGEANFHPEWQRRYIKDIIRWVTIIMEKLKNDKIIDEIPTFQVILSTHSPFVACDLPSRNLVRLQLKDTNGVNSVKVVPTPQNTGIGAYITDLLKEDFFVESLLGKLAEENIKALVDEIRKDKILSYKSKFVLDELGDEFLKSFLRGSK